jgi:hypothetical protein
MIEKGYKLIAESRYPEALEVIRYTQQGKKVLGEELIFDLLCKLLNGRDVIPKHEINLEKEIVAEMLQKCLTHLSSE